jgi:peptide chain release factor 1
VSQSATARLADQVERARREIGEALSEPGVAGDRVRYAELAKRYSDLEPAARLVERYRDAADRAREAEELLAEGEDDDLREFLREARTEAEELEREIREAMVEPDPHDEKDTIVELRAGTGGEEAALFARDLLEIYTRYAELQGFRVELLGVSAADAGGVKEATFAVKGRGAYSVFKHEGGVHRVQRVPATESSGRLHTSTATVAVLPETEDVEVKIDPNDLKIDTYRSTGPGGQSVNTTDSAVRVTHLPTNLVVSMQDEKSQLQNKEKAMRILRARLLAAEQERQDAETASTRRDQVKGGNRSEKIRTYNFKENRVTDHRINLTLHKLDRVMGGELDDLVSALVGAERAAQLNGGSPPSDN